jgi:UDP-N-acetylmuramoylalanine--D-glutamate ligase
MDRYPLGLQQYRAAKLRVYENAKVCVVNADDALTMPVRGADDRCISFGVDVGDYHLNRQQGETWLRVKGEKVLNVKEMKLTGQHNYSNALAALALADAGSAARQQPESADHLYRSGAPFPAGAGAQRRALD